MKNLLMVFLVSSCLQSTSAMPGFDMQKFANLTVKMNELVDYALDEEFPSDEYIKAVARYAYEVVGNGAFNNFCYSLPEIPTRRETPIVDKLSKFHDALIEIEDDKKSGIEDEWLLLHFIFAVEGSLSPLLQKFLGKGIESE